MPDIHARITEDDGKIVYVFTDLTVVVIDPDRGVYELRPGSGSGATWHGDWDKLVDIGHPNPNPETEAYMAAVLGQEGR